MRAALGVSVDSRWVRAVQVRRSSIIWAASAEYGDASDLEELVARLVAQAAERPHRVRLVLERDVVQLRTAEAPRMRVTQVRRYVRLQADRLFRRNGARLMVDAAPVRTNVGFGVFAAAASEPLLMEIVRACDCAHLQLEALGPASEVLPAACATAAVDGTLQLSRNGALELLSVDRGQVWQSRRVPPSEDAATNGWAAPLAALGDDAAAFAAAYAAAVRMPRLSLFPSDTRANKRRREVRRTLLVAAVAGALWLGAGAVHVGRIMTAVSHTDAELSTLAPAVERTLAIRREIARTTAAIDTVTAIERRRSNTVAMLAALTSALGDSTYLTSFSVTPDSSVHFAGYAPDPSRALARLEHVPQLVGARLEGSVTRHAMTVAGAVRHLDRFTATARWQEER